MSKHPSLEGRSVLIAEDEYFVADELAKAVLLFGGTVVGPAATLEEARLLAQEPVSLAIIDVNLRGELAFPVVDDLVRRDVPVVFATGVTGERIPPAYRHLPRWVKPYLPTALVSALRTMR